jgi:ABC-2 type transport system permease protein
MNAALLIALKDLRVLVRDRAALFWIAVFPAVFALFLGSLFHAYAARPEIRLRVALADLEGSPAARDYIEDLAAQPALVLRQGSLEGGRKLLQRGEVDALVLVLPGFGQRADFYAGGTEVLRIESDPSRSREAQVLQGLLLDVGVHTAVELELLPDPRASVSIVPARFAARAPSAAEVVTPVALLWSLIGCSAAFAISLALERRSGTLARLRTTGATDGSVLAGKAIACWASCCALAGLVLAAAVLGFGVRTERPLALLLVVACLALAFTGLMGALSTFGKSERSVAGAGWATLLLLGMVGGVMAPRMIMPPWLDAVGELSPVRWGMVALEQSLYRGGEAREWLVPCARLVATGVLGIALGSRVLRRSAA